jgi:hypothetical protein
VILPPTARKVTLTAHVVASVGWLGAVAAFLVLAVTAVTSPDVALSRGLYPAMDVLGRLVLVPLSLLSLATGLLQALGTSWGLVRYWWVVVKLVITLAAALVLLAYLGTLRTLADAAAHPADGSADLLPSLSPVVHAGAATLVLLVAAVLSVFKPRGLTRYGWRRQAAARAAAADPAQEVARHQADVTRTRTAGPPPAT